MRKLWFSITLAFVLVEWSTASQARAQTAPAPAPPQITNTYAAKFICGVQRDIDITHVLDAQTGRYSTKINVHNNTGMRINFRKKVIRLVGGEDPMNPANNKPLEKLDSDQAMEVVCSDVYKLLNIQNTHRLPRDI
jgi:hypothetical protein